jgi:hypothetical protein
MRYNKAPLNDSTAPMARPVAAQLLRAPGTDTFSRARGVYTVWPSRAVAARAEAGEVHQQWAVESFRRRLVCVCVCVFMEKHYWDYHRAAPEWLCGSRLRCTCSAPAATTENTT